MATITALAIDFDGAGSGAVVNSVTDIDWAPGNALLRPDAGESLTAPYVGQRITLLAQCAAGSYLVGRETIPVWYTREALQFNAAWREQATLAVPGSRARVLAEGGRFVVAWKYPLYAIIVALPSDTAESRRFATAFLLRFLYFFENAATDAELSFPASVDY